MAKQIVKNTAHELAVRILSEDLTTITLVDGEYGGVVPKGYAIKSIHWTQINDGAGTHIEIRRSNAIDPDILIYELAGNGNVNLVGLSDSWNAETYPVLVINSTALNHHYTLLLHMSKIL